MSPDSRLVVIGNLLVDDIVFEDGSTRMAQAGGAVIYAAFGASLWSPSVTVVSRVGDDYPADVLADLRAHGVDLGGVSRMGPRTLRAWLLYEPDGRRLLHRRGGPTHADATPEGADVEPVIGTAGAFLVSPSPIASQAALVEQLRAREDALVAIDPHDHITADSLEPWRKILRDVDVLVVSEHEIAVGELGPDVRSALSRLAGGRLRQVLLKRGEAGGVLYEVATGELTPWLAAPARVVDPTGAGDAFAGGYLAGLLGGLTRDRALLRGSVSAAYAVEGWGSDGLRRASREDASARLSDWIGA